MPPFGLTTRLWSALHQVDKLLRQSTGGVYALYVISGRRTQAEQDRLYAQGRTRPGPIVTWTRRSRHIGGRAVDVGLLERGVRLAPASVSVEDYRLIADLFKRVNHHVRWGGSFGDYGHFEI